MTASLLTLSLGGQLSSGIGVLTIPQTVTACITEAVFTNVDSAVHTVTVYVVRSGGAAGPANEIVAGQTLAQGQSWVASPLSNLVLNAGDVLAGNADAAAVVNLVVSGFVLG